MMEDFQILAASALCILSLLNYRNILKRQSIANTSSPSLPDTTPSRSLNTSPTPLPQRQRLPQTTSVSLPNASQRRPRPVRDLEKSGKKRSTKRAIIKNKLKISTDLNTVNGDKKGRRQRRCWMKAIHCDRTISSMDKLFEELTYEDSGEYMKLFRMSRSDFDLLLTKIEPAITKQTSRMRMPIPAKIRLAITLRYLATGDSYRTLRNLFKVSGSTITLIIPEVCEAINDALKNEIKLPQTPEEWLTIEEQFRTKFPRCVGVIDWKRIVSPTNKGGQRTRSFVLLAIVDSEYRFIFAETSSHNCQLWRKLESNSLNLPPDSPLPNRDMCVPYVFLGDETFALQKHLMVPFPENQAGPIERSFNYHLTSTRGISDNAFGVLTSAFRIFKKPIDIEKAKVSLITMTCILLHNFLRTSETSRSIYTPPGTFDSFHNGIFVEGSWRQNTEAGAIRSVPHDHTIPPPIALDVRSEFGEYLGLKF